MTAGQRWVAIAALGASSWATASAVNRWLDRRSATGGWFNYAPNNGLNFPPAAGSPWRGLLVWLVAIALWSGVSYVLLRRTGNDD